MSKKRGLSSDEKRIKMMEFFYENEDFFQLKDLEKRCPKEKGIVSQSVKDILNQLVSDNLVDTDKIGTSVYFWAFPSKAGQKLKQQVADLKVQLEEATKKEEILIRNIDEAKKVRKEGDDRNTMLNSLSQAETDLKCIEQELESLRENDPVVYEEMKRNANVALEAANRWTDNLFSMKKWLTDKFGIDEKTMNKQFNIPDEIDYL